MRGKLGAASAPFASARRKKYTFPMRYYSSHAKALYEKYRRLDAETLHESWLAHLPESPGLACDIGAASGRDANWLAEKGWDVIAVEPCAEFRKLAQPSNDPRVSWLDDRLPDLKQLRKLGSRFDLILVSAVWMHLPPQHRERAFRILSELLSPGGALVISLRHDADPAANAERGFFDADSDELAGLARSRALALVFHSRQDDLSGRAGVAWETLCFQLSDDGTGNLPLLRHIIVNDDMSSTYKLGLLRILLRIAEGAPGMALARSEDWVELPFGLVGLYWLKSYVPLLRQNIRQHGNRRLGYGFAKEDFDALSARFSAFDLRIGASFQGPQGAVVTGAIGDACANIRNMPVRYTTFPGQNRQVFEYQAPETRWQRGEGPIELNKRYLARFGRLRIPAPLWRTLGQYACWLEPAIVNEWVKLLRGWGVSYDDAAYHRALEWEQGRRDTSQVRNRAETLLQEGRKIVCAWSNARIRRNGNYDIDHCFPWSHWFNNDLWNLVPATTKVNAQKGDKLPSARQIVQSKERIVNWWREAYECNSLKRRFQLEAEAALPLLVEADNDLEDIFDAMLMQRKNLRANQQLVEWNCNL